MTTVLVMAAHPDDEVLGCGGTIARHAARGDEVHVVLVADGTSSRPGAVGRRDLIEARAAQAAEAARLLGAQPPRLLGLPDQRLDSASLLDLTQALERVLGDVRPSIVYTHHGADLNLDHRLVFQAVLTACRPVPGSSVTKIYTFETMSSTEWSAPAIGSGFQPSRFVDISDEFETKLSALAAYASEMREFPHPRSIEAVKALALFRGASAGLRAAEAFEVIRDIER